MTSAAAPHPCRPGRIPHYEVVVVGAGFGGIGMGVALKKADIGDFVILEKASELGGVWRDNTYPDCNCDVPFHAYAFSFAPYHNRHIRYPGQRDILAYLHTVAADHDLLAHLRCDSELSEATYLDTTGHWWLTITHGHHLTTRTLICALGQLHRPHIPTIPGQDEFTGPAFHTARWNHHHDLHGRGVAIIGTGASGTQLLPAIAAVAKNVRVFQRTPPWVLPKPRLRFGPLTRTALRIPGAHRLYRHTLNYTADTVLAPIMRRGWSARPAEWAARHFLHQQIRDPALPAKLTPDYPLGGKRILFDSTYYQALTRPNVELITTPISRITPTGIRTDDHRHHHADAIVYATGFQATEFLAPVTVRGQRATILHHQWRSGPSALLGIALPGYPNLFLLAGPNTFTPAGSNPAMKEHEIEFIIRCLQWRQRIGAYAIAVDPTAMQAYQQQLDQALARTVWSSTHSWYRHPNGRTTNPWPNSVRAYARALNRSPAHWFQPITCQGALRALGGSVVKTPAVEGGWHTTGAKSTLAVHNRCAQ
ncbi:flavin-containing monooxygenase [Nocardia brasiliensis]|uniref:flavin-containing monooxygenase n=1 Tax=Nocardia brasiliensis TaxID=37326 RepID=UPI00245446AD|nr:NAD(P)/FAD-dependent oxidoreductase [Nocardia brasiliensis]